MMTEEIILLMERLQLLHEAYEKREYARFSNQFQFEFYYWMQFKLLRDLIDQQLFLVKPFQHKED